MSQTPAQQCTAGASHLLHHCFSKLHARVRGVLLQCSSWPGELGEAPSSAFLTSFLGTWSPLATEDRASPDTHTVARSMSTVTLL